MEKKYELVVIQAENGELTIAKRNNGFAPFEILGFLSWAQQDITKQLGDETKPDKVTREYVEQHPLTEE